MKQNNTQIYIKFVFFALAYIYSSQYEVNKSIENIILEKYMEKRPTEIFKVWFKLFENSRDYKLNSEEGLRRYYIFKENLKQIKHHNLKKTWEMGLDQFSDLTFDEFSKKYLTYMSKDDKMQNISLIQIFNWNNFKPVVSYYTKNDTVKFKNIDWRNYCPIIHNQLCGNCYAHATAVAFDCGINIKANITNYFKSSVQQLTDCNPFTNGCKGGNPEYSLFYYHSVGVFSEIDYQTNDIQKSCQYDKLISNGIKPLKNLIGLETLCYPLSNKMDDCRYTISAYQILKKGPFATCIDATSLFGYKNGIVDLNNCKTVNHVVVVVGFGIDPAGNYWIVQNSWGKSWGENGYIRILIKDDDKHNCFMLNEVTRPIF